MEVPKIIQNALEMRTKHAERFNHYDYIVSNWLDKNNISVESFDTHGGTESIVNPKESQKRILNAIRNKK